MIIQNEEAIRIIRNGAKLTLAEGFPQALLPNVVPVMDMTPRFHRNSNIVKYLSSAGNNIIYTVPEGKNFYLSAIYLSSSKSATETGTVSSVTATIDGVSVTLLSIASITLTQHLDSLSLSLPVPIKIDSGTSINLIVSGTWIANRVTIIGYNVDSQI